MSELHDTEDTQGHCDSCHETISECWNNGEPHTAYTVNTNLEKSGFLPDGEKGVLTDAFIFKEIDIDKAETEVDTGSVDEVLYMTLVISPLEQTQSGLPAPGPAPEPLDTAQPAQVDQQDVSNDMLWLQI